MIEAPHFSAAGAKQSKGVALPAALFDGTVNEPVLHQAVITFLANQRQGTHQTKTRHFVSGGNQKPWRQKGTGRARQGSIRSPLWPGGGTMFGPHPREYRLGINRKLKRLARSSAFNARAREGAVMVIDRFAYDAPKTQRLAALVARLGLEGRKVLILTNGVNEYVYLSGRNLPAVHVMPYADVSAYHVLWSDAVLVEGAAIGHELAPVADTEPEPRAKRERKAAPAKAKRASDVARGSQKRKVKKMAKGQRKR